MDLKHQILAKFLLYISMNTLSDGWPSKFNNIFIRQDIFNL